MPQPVVYVVFAAPFVIFIAGLAIASFWSSRAPAPADAAHSAPDA